ncbi:hypothetical protein [Fibrobacter intestinalis]|uniref:Uncharacterized protein n=1 Tax=Fibrobacter intestinalis TaxID=28122 RepID=A0A1T4NJ08_9BACT|nr:MULTISPECIES: hypothetical protein [Fibrobacter]PBC72515.1 hypothetical protein BGW94_0086 [Fibrobacter sp. NR9]SJZ79036.1 hypothetical protein SAMN02745108_01609 [Fibrobacter intestinalis]
MHNGEQALENLENLVADFQKEPICVQVDSGYGSLDLDGVKEKAAFAKCKKENGWKKHEHQYRIPNDVLKQVYKCLKAWDAPKEFADFDELYKELEKRIGNLEGVGSLMLYDTALRFAKYYRLKPKQVYLHAGAYEGAKLLKSKGLLNAPLARTLPVNAFPKPLQKLGAKEIEIFLCTRKNQIAGV